MSGLELESVDKLYYGGYTALLNISFCANKGLTCFIGENGSGKSTLLRLISGLEEITRGKMWCNGEDLAFMSIKDRNIGFLDTSLPAIKGRKIVFDIIAYPLKLRGEDKSNANDLVLQIANSWGIVDLLRYRADMLSEYQKALVGLARLTVLDRKIYLLDNPLKGLYCKDRLLVASKIGKFFNNSDKIALFATDWVEEAVALSPNNFGVLAYSTLSDYGKLNDILKFPNTLACAKMFDKHFNILECTLNNKKINILSKSLLLTQIFISNVFKKVYAVFPISAVIVGEGDFLGTVIDCKQLTDGYYLDINIDNNTISAKCTKCFNIGEQLCFDIDLRTLNIYDYDSEYNIVAKEGRL